ASAAQVSMYLFHLPPKTSAYEIFLLRFFISHVITGIDPREYAFVTPNPWNGVDQSAYHIMYAVRFPTCVAQLSHAVIPGLPSGALSMKTPVAMPFGGATIVERIAPGSMI